MILEITSNCASGDIESECRDSVEIIARPIVANRRAAVASSKICQICFGVVIAGDPDRGPAGLPFVAFRPGLAAGLSWCRHSVSPPQLLACFGIEGCHEAADSELTAGRAHHNRDIVPSASY